MSNELWGILITAAINIFGGVFAAGILYNRVNSIERNFQDFRQDMKERIQRLEEFLFVPKKG